VPNVAIVGRFAASLEDAIRRNLTGWTDGMLQSHAKLIAENIRRVALGETPLNVVDP
jgi:hypothetical protein